MGCDIHPYVEARPGSHGAWIAVVETDAPARKALVRRITEPGMPEAAIDSIVRLSDLASHDDIDEDGFPQIEWDIMRHYDLFAVLAGVRNYGDRQLPISSPRGLPPDVSSLIQKASDRWDSDGHSHSYLTLRELLANKERLDGMALVLEGMRALVTGPVTPDDVRMVFWFDN